MDWRAISEIEDLLDEYDEALVARMFRGDLDYTVVHRDDTGAIFDTRWRLPLDMSDGWQWFAIIPPPPWRAR